MLIRKPPKDVFRCVVEPTLLTQFWLAKASTRLELGGKVRWEFRVPGAVDELIVKELQEPHGISLESIDGTQTRWAFEEHREGTRVSVAQSGFSGSGDEAVRAALDAVGGFTLVLAELKLLLEQGHAMQLVDDQATLLSESKSLDA